MLLCMINDSRLYELLQRHPKKELTPEEEDLLNNWYDQLDQPAADSLPLEIIKRKVWLSISVRLGLKPKSSIPWLRFTAVASIIVLITCSVVYTRLNNSKHLSQIKEPVSLNTVRSPQGEQTKVILSDGSVVWLNGNAVLNYPSSFDSSRNVFLLQGEAFFEVARDTTKPFMVHSGNMYTQVLGTSFNIRTGKGKYMVAVASGKVKVYHSYHGGRSLIAKMLEAGDRLVTDSSGNNPDVDTLDKRLYKGWISKSYQVKDISLAGITYCMESLYEAEILILHKELKNLRFTTSFSNTDKIEDILSRLSLAGNFHYRMGSEGKIIIY